MSCLCSEFGLFALSNSTRPPSLTLTARLQANKRVLLMGSHLQVLGHSVDGNPASSVMYCLALHWVGTYNWHKRPLVPDQTNQLIPTEWFPRLVPSATTARLIMMSKQVLVPFDDTVETNASIDSVLLSLGGRIAKLHTIIRSFAL